MRGEGVHDARERFGLGATGDAHAVFDRRRRPLPLAVVGHLDLELHHAPS
jgi:hypothetical protein